MENTLIITIEESGDRLDALLARVTPELSRAAAQRLIESGFVTINGKQTQKNHSVRVGETISLTLPEVTASELLPENIPLDIVFEDDELIVINKARGMVVHPAPGHSNGTLVNALLHHCGDTLSGVGGERRPGIVHRIDKDSSGLLIIAKNDASHRNLSAQLADRSLGRIYEAIAIGGFRGDSGTVTAPIGRHPSNRKKMTVTTKNSREAVTHWEVLERYPGMTHIRCRLETGRTHQIRVHMAHIGRPLLGDEVYGGKRFGKEPWGQYLHADEIHFVHPKSGECMSFNAPLPDYFLATLDKLKKLR